MRKELLFESRGARLMRSSWRAGGDELPLAWQSEDRPRVSFPGSPLLFGGRGRPELASPGDAVVLDGGLEHGVRRPVAGAGYSVWICVDPEVFDGLCGGTARTRLRTRAGGRLVLTPDVRPALAIGEIARGSDAGVLDRVEAEALLYSVVEKVCGGARDPGPGRGARGAHTDAVVHAISMLVDDADAPTLGDIGAAVGMSPHHFCRVFKRSTGMTVQGFRRRARLLRAAGRVLEGDAPLAAIADACGFSDQPHMTRAFKDAFGVPPARLARGTPRLVQMRKILQDTVARGS